MTNENGYISHEWYSSFILSHFSLNIIKTPDSKEWDGNSQKVNLAQRMSEIDFLTISICSLESGILIIFNEIEWEMTENDQGMSIMTVRAQKV